MSAIVATPMPSGEMLGERFFAALTARSVEQVEPLLSEQASFRHHPLPAIRGKARLLRVIKKFTRLCQSWEIVEIHSAAVSGNRHMYERSERLRLFGVSFTVRGVMLFETDNDYIISITDYCDLLHCSAAFTGAAIKTILLLPFRLLGSKS